MSTTVLLVLVLGGCLVMHLFMMRRHGHGESHGSAEGKSKDQEEKDKIHSGHGSCH